MNKIFKKLLIGILFALLAIPIVSKINVYADVLSTGNLYKVPAAAQKATIGNAANVTTIDFSFLQYTSASRTGDGIPIVLENRMIIIATNENGEQLAKLDFGDKAEKIGEWNHQSGTRGDPDYDNSRWNDWKAEGSATMTIPSNKTHNTIYLDATTSTWFSGYNPWSHWEPAGDLVQAISYTVNGLNAPSYTSGATLTKVDLSYTNNVTSAAYSVGASGATSYEWWLDGAKTATGATYTAKIENLSHGNHTLYCKAINSAGSTPTNTITFNVNKTPKISSGNLTHIKYK